MKRFFCVLLIALLLCFCGALAEEEMDLQAMGTDALLQLRSRIDEELTRRISGQSGAIYDGIYICGVDIRPGMYRILCQQATDAEYSCTVNLFLTRDDFQMYARSRLLNYTYRYFEAQLDVGETVQIHLTEGMALEIMDGVCLIEAVQPAWAP